jgi:multisubunit Na+/H+ antiporter MnhB subunit
MNKQNDRDRKRIDTVAVPVFFLMVGLTALLGKIFYSMPHTKMGLADEVANHLAESGITSPVTAVLLNFRGYDTLLEVMVLLMALTGVWSLTKALFSDRFENISPVQHCLVRLLTPLMCLVAAYLVWQGSSLAGGAFQGGAVLAGVGVLMLVTDMPGLQTIPIQPLRYCLVLGPAVFLGVALFCLFYEGGLLVYPVRFAGSYLLLIEAACAISIGLTLAGLFAGGRPHDKKEKQS